MLSRYRVPVSGRDFADSISELSKKCGEFKLDIFRSTIINDTVDGYKIRNFMGIINSFLRTWEAYAMELQDQIRSANVNTDSDSYSVIGYNDIKPFIFSNNDYASILQFTDGIVKGAKNSDITKESNYEDFFTMTVRKAFKDRPADAGMMVGEVTSLSTSESSAHESALFKSIKGKNMFDNNDRMEIYKAVDKTIEYLVNDILGTDSDVYSYFTGPMRTSACNWIIEYVKITLTAYACRIYAISAYAAPYLKSSNVITPAKPIKESVEETPGYTEYTFMRDLDESIIHNPATFQTYVDKVKEWAATFSCTAAGQDIDSFIKCVSCDILKENPVYNKLISNSLYDYFEDHEYDFSGQNYQVIKSYCFCGPDIDASKIVRHVKDFITSPNLGNGVTTSPLQDVSEIIKNIEPSSESRQGYEQLALDIIFAHLLFARSLVETNNAITKFNDQMNNMPDERIRDLSDMSEIQKMIIDIYKTVGVAVLFRCRDIEMKINELRRADIKNKMEELSIKIPGTLKSDYSKDDNNAMSAPETNRAISEAVDTISIDSQMDRLLIYNEYVKSIPGMENDWYYSEAFSFQAIIDKILAIIKSIGAKWNEFFNNAQFKAAAAWCEKNKAALNSSNFNGTMTVNNFNFRGTEHLDKMVNTIKGFDPKTATEQAKVDDYEKNLYGDFYENFHKDNNPDKAAIYQNMILYKAQDKTVPTTSVADAAIKGNEFLGKWLDAVTSYTTTLKSCNDYNASLTNAVNSLKAKVLQLKPEEVANDADEATKKAAEQKQQTYDLAQTALAKTQQAITDLYTPMVQIITGMLRTEYKYIQEAWSLRVTQETAAQQQSQPTQPTQQPAQS